MGACPPRWGSEHGATLRDPRSGRRVAPLRGGVARTRRCWSSPARSESGTSAVGTERTSALDAGWGHWNGLSCAVSTDLACLCVVSSKVVVGPGRVVLRAPQQGDVDGRVLSLWVLAARCVLSAGQQVSRTSHHHHHQPTDPPTNQGLLSIPGPSGVESHHVAGSEVPLADPSVVLAVDHVPEAAPRTFHRPSRPTRDGERPTSTRGSAPRALE